MFASRRHDQGALTEKKSVLRWETNVGGDRNADDAVDGSAVDEDGEGIFALSP